MHMYCSVDAAETKGAQYLLDDVDVDDPGYLELERRIAKTCLSPEPELGVGRIDFRKLQRSAQAGKAFFRDA